MASNGSQRLPTAPFDYKHTLLLFSSSMTPTDFQRLPSRELTPQPHSKASSGDGDDQDGEDNSTESVHGICNLLEEAGMTCKRCAGPAEAIERAKELQVYSHLKSGQIYN